MEYTLNERNSYHDRSDGNTALAAIPPHKNDIVLKRISSNVVQFKIKLIQFCENLVKHAHELKTSFTTPQEALTYLDSLNQKLERNSTENYMLLYAEFMELINKVNEENKIYDEQEKENCLYDEANIVKIKLADKLEEVCVDMPKKKSKTKGIRSRLDILQIEEKNVHVKIKEGLNQANLINSSNRVEVFNYKCNPDTNMETFMEEDDEFPELDPDLLQAMKESLNTVNLTKAPDKNPILNERIDEGEQINTESNCQMLMTDTNVQDFDDINENHLEKESHKEITTQATSDENMQNGFNTKSNEDVLDMISDCDSDSSLNSILSIKIKRKDDKKTARNWKLMVDIPLKEQLLCDNFHRQSDDELEKINNRLEESFKKNPGLRNKRRRIKSSSSSSSSSLLNNSLSSYLSDSSDDTSIDHTSYHSVSSIASNSDSSISNSSSLSESSDNDDVLNAISENTDSDSLDSFSSDEKKTEDIKKKVRKKTSKHLHNIDMYNGDDSDVDDKLPSKSDSSWKHDPLLNAKFDYDSDVSDIDVKPKINSTFISGMTISLEETEDEDSDIEFISSSLKRIRENNEDTDTSPTTKKGRRNIRELLSESQLNQATKDAHIAEKERIERLRSKQKYLIELSQTKEIASDSIVLDACEENLIIVHPALTSRLKEHQKKGVRFMWDNCYESVKRLSEDPGGGCILAHCMGLGKTLQVVTLVHTLFSHPVTLTKKVLIICPLSTVINWRSEFKGAMKLTKEPLPSMIIYSIGKDKRETVIQQWDKSGGVLLMGYDSFVAAVKNYNELMTKYLVDPGPDLVVCDEGHLLKSGKSDRTTFISKINTKRRIVLTGTPMQNNLEEYYYMVAFIKPQFLGNFHEYRNRFVNPIKNGQFEDSSDVDIKLMKKRSHVLHKMTKNFIQRYEESELFQHLPTKYDYALKIELHDVQIKLYKKFINFCIATNKHKLFANLYNIRLICTHPNMLVLQQDYYNKVIRKKSLSELRQQLLEINQEIDPLWWINDIPHDTETNFSYGPKLVVMMSIIKTSMLQNEKVLVFSSSRLELTLIEMFLKADDTSWKIEETYFRMDGTVPLVKRNEFCEIFNDPFSRVKVFLLTNKVGGLGLNLTGANRAIIMDVSWNPSLDTQSIFRIYRLGQKKPCYVYRLIAKGTMEEVIYDRSVTKQAIAGRVVDEMQITRHFKSSDIEEMYRCDLEKRPRAMPKLPKDTLLASMLKEHTCIFSYEDHKELLQNLPHEELGEDEMELAWEEYEKEKNYVPPPYPILPSTSNMNVTFTSRGDKIPTAPTSPPIVDRISVLTPPSSSNAQTKSASNRKKALDPLIMFETKKGNVIARFTPEGDIIPDKSWDVTPSQIQTAKDLNIRPTTGLSRVYVIAADGNLKDFNRYRIPLNSDKKTNVARNAKQVPNVISEVINLDDDNSNANENANEDYADIPTIILDELDD